ncbi:hypothetical protein BJF79_12890 [Actinomadura sp. CNU-125]|nr:hypothetical protein BJF79_12890 [Actinomadura sp. CNU-125]
MTDGEPCSALSRARAVTSRSTSLGSPALMASCQDGSGQPADSAANDVRRYRPGWRSPVPARAPGEVNTVT